MISFSCSTIVSDRRRALAAQPSESYFKGTTGNSHLQEIAGVASRLCSALDCPPSEKWTILSCSSSRERRKVGMSYLCSSPTDLPVRLPLSESLKFCHLVLYLHSLANGYRKWRRCHLWPGRRIFDSTSWEFRQFLKEAFACFKTGLPLIPDRQRPPWLCFANFTFLPPPICTDTLELWLRQENNRQPEYFMVEIKVSRYGKGGKVSLVL